MLALATSKGAFASPGNESSCSMLTLAVTSGCGLLTTTANCCAAALSEALTLALSRSTAQYSQPTLLRCCSAWLHRSMQLPERQALPVVGSQVLPGVITSPLASHCWVVWPSQEPAFGTQVLHWNSPGTHTRPWALQSSRVTQVSLPPSFWHSCRPPEHR